MAHDQKVPVASVADESWMSDQELLALFQARDEKAIRETERKYGVMLEKIAFDILADSEDVKECVNDTYLALWKSIPPAAPQSLSAFLTVILRRIAINRYKERNRQKRVPSAMTEALSELEGILPSDDNVERAYEAKELGQLISAYVRGLSDTRRYIFVERYYMSATVEDIAKELGRTASAVYKELGKIKQGLKEYLERNGVSV